MPHLALGLDSSTQSLSAALIDIESRQRVADLGVDYLSEESLRATGIGEDYILPPDENGDARQPVSLFFAALDFLLANLKKKLARDGLSNADIAAINVSGQQHGHVLLNQQAETVFAGLNEKKTPLGSLQIILAPALAVPWARIWRTSNTADEASTVRQRLGGAQQLIEISGSDGPLRFSAFGIRKTALKYPDAYHQTALIHQISTLIPAALTGRTSIPLDWGNACGSSLMDYRRMVWSEQLLEAVAGDLPGGADGLRTRLPALSPAITPAGTVARYFVERHGFDPACVVGIGSGDNPMSKVLVEDSLLSLGTSFVIMAATDGATLDERGYANAMYDGLDRPFCFGCRTNGALRWDDVRAIHCLAKNDYAAADTALASTPVGNDGRMMLWHREAESFPVAGQCEIIRRGYEQPELAADYAGIIESSLASVYLNSRHFMASGGTLYVTGGPSSSGNVLRRVAAIFNREVVAVESGGAALGAAASAACLYHKDQGKQIDPAAYCSSLLEHTSAVSPRPEDVRACHGENGLISRYTQLEQRLIANQ